MGKKIQMHQLLPSGTYEQLFPKTLADQVVDEATGTTVAAHIASRANPHGVTKEQLGLGNVDNVKQASATDFTAHTQAAGLHVTTALQNTWNAKETTTGAQAKADAALAAAKVYAQNAVANGSAADPNTTQESYILTNHANSPGGGLYWHITTLFYSTLTGNRAQIAVSYNATGATRMQTRSLYGTTWTAWGEHTTTAQAQALVDAHANLKTNPHGVTASQVGLGSVNNYGLATQAEAEAGTSNLKYMTPLRTKEAILKLAPPPTAATVTITDAGNYYDGGNTEAALQEIGSVIAGTNSNLAAVAQALARL